MYINDADFLFTETTVLRSFFQKNNIQSYDFFEVLLYKEFWHTIQDCRVEIFDATNLEIRAALGR